MNINIGREAFVDNPLKNNLRPLPQIDPGPCREPCVEIEDQKPVFVLYGPIEVPYNGLKIPFWIVRVLDGDYRDRVGWMAEINELGKDQLVGM